MPRATVVVPVHDGAETLPACLAALRDLPADVDLVVVDDASTDGSGALARGFGVRVLTRPARGGASAARNSGVAATDADILVFVDADVVLRPDAVARLLARLEADPELLGVNGILALDLGTPGLVTAFTNTSIHYQHLRHGAYVASAFTSLCALRRSALTQMGGWDERSSRFADDVGSRWRLPPRSVALELGAQGEHLKAVHLRGLLDHRRRVGLHFVRSLAENLGAARARPSSVLLDTRYPLPTALAAGTILLLPLWLLRPRLLTLPALAFTLVNLDFALFTLDHRGAVEALLAVPISALEGFAYGTGLAQGAIVQLRRTLGPPAAARALRP